PLRSVMSQVLNDLSDPITQSSAEIIMPRKLPVVSGDSTLLFQIFVSLIDNALKYRRPRVRPKVTMSYERDGEHVLVRVADNGVGIPADCHEKVFDIFQRLHSQDQVPGTGIGLAIMRKAVRALEGQVWLESTVGKGTTFYVKLPLESGKGKESNLNRRK
ncbi:MAG: ATP-binding protein, partial [Deltaproteobacteria bacterium]